MPWLYLSIAIVFEVVATSALKSSEGFTRLTPSLLVVVGYGVAFYCLSVALRSMPLGIIYAIWSGAGIVLMTLVGWLVYGETLGWMALLGMGLITVGVIILNAVA
ncbi:DMT family transporter [Rhodoferax antarcticus]|uniref:Small multidrug resistance family protein n=1 Tax=Rhodoferax antarcticus ANT.BR TaxID=1111071 RepID=A0A1Q8YEB7_9BURK|nr:multidrug efflux SMR transporter [Rhodoferax antarcticus]APW48248.1 QacE family quaternary ammonium compound efflux SMR transporter [Rhodoferax antarcticus]OLP06200.1 small multidrug resistance family protein [Rhodoferax antarcticus ANT.BR]